jgi:hypothetical protein
MNGIVGPPQDNTIISLFDSMQGSNVRGDMPSIWVSIRVAIAGAWVKQTLHKSA